MTKQMSYTKIENQLRPIFRERLDQAESVEDVKKFFVYTIQELLENAMGENGTVNFEDVCLDPDNEPGFALGPGVTERQAFQEVWNDSDMPRILSSFAETAKNRYRRLEKNPAKTEAKMYHGHD